MTHTSSTFKFSEAMNESNTNLEMSNRQAAFRGGYFQTENCGPIIVFSAQEARACLQNRTINVAGDSYTRMLYMGLIDILNGWERTAPVHMSGKDRKRMLRRYMAAAELLLTPIGVNVHFVCTMECYGPSVDTCMKCMKDSILKTHPSANYMSFQIHRLRALTHQQDLNYLDTWTHELESILTHIPNLIWGSAPCLHRHLLPESHQNSSMKNDSDIMYQKLFELVRTNPCVQRVPILDLYTITDKCVWENCSDDGGHRHWFAARMKAQLFLNTICESERQPDNTVVTKFVTKRLSSDVPKSNQLGCGVLL